MQNRLKLVALFVALGTTTLLTACGGGGGGSEDVLAGKQATYTIGGTVSGLNAVAGQPVPVITVTNTSKVVSSIASMTISSNGPYTFPAAPAGTEYSLAITAPTGYGCTFPLANGNNIVGNAAVTNINITCTAGTYTIGGTVSGLGANNPSLQLGNNGNVLSISGDGPFTFVQNAANGSAYNVTVATPHIHYICEFSGAATSGTVNAANISNIALACSAPIHVSVSGLGAGNAIQLTNTYALPGASSTTQTLAISGDQSLSFATRLPSGSTYAVTVSTPHPNFNCTPINGTGTVGVAAINVGIACVAAPIMTVTNVSPTNGTADVARNSNAAISFSALLNASTVSVGNVTLLSGAGSQNIAANVSGNQITVTSIRPLLPLTTYSLNVNASVRGLNNDRLLSAVTSSFVTRDGQWQGSFLMEHDDTARAVTPRIAVSASGTAIAMWGITDINLVTNTYVSHFSELGAWVPPSLLLSNSGPPKLAINALGNGMMVFRQNDIAYSRRYDAATKAWENATPMGPGCPDATGETIALDQTGNAITVWVRNEGLRFSIFACRYSPVSGWGQALRIDNAVGTPSNPVLAFDGTGNALVAWQQLDSARYSRIYFNRNAADGIWAGAYPISDAATSAYAPSIAVSGNGAAVLAWQQLLNIGQFDIYASRYSVTSGWELSVSITGGNTTGATNPRVAIDSIGNALVVWPQVVGANLRAYANRNVVDRGWEQSTPLENGITGNTTVQDIVVDPSGNGIVILQHEETPQRSSIYASRYAVQGGWRPAVLLETDSGNAHSAQIGVDASGNAIAVWQQYDGTQDSIFANRLE